MLVFFNSICNILFSAQTGNIDQLDMRRHAVAHIAWGCDDRYWYNVGTLLLDSHLNSAQLKHTTTLFSLSNHYILSREWRVIVDQVQINSHGRPDDTIISQVGADWGRMCFKSVKTLEALHS